MFINNLSSIIHHDQPSTSQADTDTHVAGEHEEVQAI